MTLEEARQLKPGDRVLVEATVRAFDGHVYECGNVRIAINVVNLAHDEAWSCVRYEDIREKIAPPRRKFSKGDIVSRNGHLYYVAEDEQEDGKVLLDCWGDGIMHTRADLLTLERAVEDRADRKGGEV